ncbi:MAG: HU family DNA-binding protein [Planctomycetota bacterium]|nr:MAG: HU family DNA-binding protein [Planctomycetota bacterium]
MKNHFASFALLLSIFWCGQGVLAAQPSSKRVTFEELVKMVAQKSTLSQQKTRVVLRNFLAILKKRLQHGKEINLRGLGTFYVKKAKARKGYHPKTRKIIQIPARKYLRFRASLAFRKSLNGKSFKGKASKKVRKKKNSRQGRKGKKMKS